MLYDESLFNEILITMNTKKMLYGFLTLCILFIAAACTKDSADQAEYEFGIDRMDVQTDNRNSIDRMDVQTDNAQSIDRMDVQTEN